jgi:hypothetical protein
MTRGSGREEQSEQTSRVCPRGRAPWQCGDDWYRWCRFRHWCHARLEKEEATNTRSSGEMQRREDQKRRKTCKPCLSATWCFVNGLHQGTCQRGNASCIDYPTPQPGDKSFGCCFHQNPHDQITAPPTRTFHKLS